MFEYIHVLFALLAGIIFTIIMYALGISLEQWLFNVIVIMVVMLVLGYFLKIYLKNRVFYNEDIDNEEIEINNEEVVAEDEDVHDRIVENNGSNLNFDDDDDDE